MLNRLRIWWAARRYKRQLERAAQERWWKILARPRAPEDLQMCSLWEQVLTAQPPTLGEELRLMRWLADAYPEDDA